MFKSFDLFSDSNTPEDYDLINQDNNISFQNINDRSNDLFSFSYEDNRIPSISNMLNNRIDNSIIEKHTKIDIEKKPSEKNLFEGNKVTFSESKTPTKKNKNTKLGRKRKDDNEKGKHNRFSDDILRRKCKHILLKFVFIFINEIIKKIYNNNIGNGYFIKQLLTLNKKQKSNTSIKYNQEFLYKSLRDIFSDDISSKYTNYNLKHNKLLIKELISEKNEEKRKYFQNLFSLNFLQCLKHFRGQESIKELEGMKLFNEIKNELNTEDDDNENYKKALENYINKYEDIILRKKPKKSRKK